MSRPIVVIPACTKLIEGHAFDAVGRKYSAAIAEVAECQPLLAPLGASMADIGAVLEVADAILLSGSVSNVAPEHYGKEPPIKPDALDPMRERRALYAGERGLVDRLIVEGTERTREAVKQTVFDARKAMGLTSTFVRMRRSSRASAKVGE